MEHIKPFALVVLLIMSFIGFGMDASFEFWIEFFRQKTLHINVNVSRYCEYNTSAIKSAKIEEKLIL